ncbi:MAG: DUF7005 family protein [Acidobacteriota bacterium]
MDDQERAGVLAALGAEGAVVEELLARNSVPAGPPVGANPPVLPLTDEPHIEAWRRYAGAARATGAWEALRAVFPQLRFPIRAGISSEAAYRAATLKGEATAESVEHLRLEDPGALELAIHDTLAGGVPVIVAGTRGDFENLVRAFTSRNEPRPVPPSMGACHVSGLNNWDRIAAHRRSWEAQDPGRCGDSTAWHEEFRRLVARKDLYQDRFVILSRGPYSNVPAAETGLPEGEWRELSLVLRREHECTHHFTLRAFGRLGNNVLEELLADFVGLVRAFGAYRPELAARFLGLEGFPIYRDGGRLENYRGEPPLSDRAFEILTGVTHAAIGNLAAVAERRPERLATPKALAELVFVLTTVTLEELAAPGFRDRADSLLASRFGSRSGAAR